jgi:hypothetical protein
MGARDFRGNVEAKAEPRRSLVAAKKGLKKPLRGSRLDGSAFVRDGQLQTPFICGRPYADRPPWRAVFDRIADEVRDDLGDALRVAIDRVRQSYADIDRIFAYVAQLADHLFNVIEERGIGIALQ